MDMETLILILQMVPNGIMPIIRGRMHPEIFVSIPEADPMPTGWKHAASSTVYYPEGFKRIVFIG